MPTKILTLSTLYPNREQQQHGIYIENRVRHIVASGRVSVKVVAPVPWFPIGFQQAGKYSVFARVPHSENRCDIHVLHPRYPVIPKVGMTLSPFLLAGALLQPLRAMVRDGHRFDVIDAYYFYPDGVAAALLGRYFGKPVVISALGSDINIFPKYRCPRAMITWAARQASGITTVSRALKDELTSMGIAEEAIRVILHGVDLDVFAFGADRQVMRDQLGLKRTTLLMVGNLVKLKGHNLTLQALRELKDVELLVIGQGKEERSLKKLADSLGVAQRVRFVGYIPQDKLPVYYSAADALVMPSSSEGIPNVLLESMACGTPVIATRVGGIPEVVTKPEAGVLMEDRTVEALVEATMKLVSAPPDRRAVRCYVEQYSWQRTTEQHLELLDDVLCTNR